VCAGYVHVRPHVKTWFTIAAVLVANAALIFFAVAPGVVTYAELQPAGITCSSCTSPEVQAALTRAASAGRAQIQGLVLSHMWWVAALAIANFVVVLVLLFGNTRRARNAV
jgi:hypothetical protein